MACIELEYACFAYLHTASLALVYNHFFDHCEAWSGVLAVFQETLMFAQIGVGAPRMRAFVCELLEDNTLTVINQSYLLLLISLTLTFTTLYLVPRKLDSFHSISLHIYYT